MTVAEPSSPHLEIRRLEPQPYACIAATTTPREVGAMLRRILSEVQEYVARNSLEPVGQPLARYYRYERDVVEMDAGIRVTTPGEGDGTVTVNELPGGDVAVALHIGSYRTLRGTYDALAAWLEREGRTPREAPWELYITDATTEPDPARRQTEIYWPVQ
jgi:effector-binding domain-containing protein